MPAVAATASARISAPPTAQPPDAELRAILGEIDRRPDRGRRCARWSSFGTRHTLSTQDDPVRGIGAARDWIFEQLQRYAAASGGRMTVELQSFVQPGVAADPGAHPHHQRHRHPARHRPTPNRIYVVTGHYDSRVTDVMNATADAPGADDDASGVAVGDGAGPGDGHPAAPRRRSSSPPSPARSRACTARPHGPGASRTPAPTSRACSATTSSAAAPPTTARATGTRCGCSPRACRHRGDARRRPTIRRRGRRRERLARRGSSAGSSRDVAENDGHRHARAQ